MCGMWKTADRAIQNQTLSQVWWDVWKLKDWVPETIIQIRGSGAIARRLFECGCFNASRAEPASNDEAWDHWWNNLGCWKCKNMYWCRTTKVWVIFWLKLKCYPLFEREKWSWWGVDWTWRQARPNWFLWRESFRNRADWGYPGDNYFHSAVFNLSEVLGGRFNWRQLHSSWKHEQWSVRPGVFFGVVKSLISIGVKLVPNL